jgi:hypothetical protein
MWWYIRIGRLPGAGHGVPGIHDGVGEGDIVGVALAVGVGGEMVGVGERDGVGVGKRGAPSLWVQAARRATAATSITKVAMRLARRGEARRSTASRGGDRRRMFMTGASPRLTLLYRNNAFARGK